MCSNRGLAPNWDNSHEPTPVPTDQNGLMSLGAIHYTYDTRDTLRASLFDEHQWYLAALADAGAMIAYGPFEDEAEPGALLIATTLTTSDIHVGTWGAHPTRSPPLMNGSEFVWSASSTSFTAMKASTTA